MGTTVPQTLVPGLCVCVCEQTQGCPWHGPAGRVTGGGGECAARGGDGETVAPSNTPVADRVPPGEPGRPDEEAQT